MTNIIRLILIILLLLFFECKPKTESLPKEIAGQYMTSFVLNPNGIAYYKDPTDLKSKLGVIPYKAMFGREIKNKLYEENNSEPKKIWYEGKEGFIRYDNLSNEDIITFIKNDNAEFGVIESGEAILYNSPFLDSGKVIKLKQFEIVTGVINGKDVRNKWYRVIDKEGNHGYTQSSIEKYYSHSQAQEAVEKKILHKTGYINIKTENPDLISENEFKKISVNKASFITHKHANLYESDFSMLINGKKYYSIYAWKIEKKDRREKNEEKDLGNNRIYSIIRLFISEDNIEFIPQEKFTEYTIGQTKFTGDKKLLYAIAREYPEQFFNLTNVNSWKIGTLANGESLYLVQCQKDISFQYISLILRKSDDNYFSTDFVKYDRVDQHSIQDIDGDGTYEFLVEEDERSFVIYNLFGMRNGVYQEIATVDSISSKSNGIIEKVNFVYNEEKESYYKPGKRAYGSFRYDKGNLIPVKIKYR